MVSPVVVSESAEARVLSAFNALRVLDRPSSTANDVAEVLESDPALAEQLLRMARSPLFGVRADDLSVSRAVVLLGFLSVRKMAVLHLCRTLSATTPDAVAGARWKRALWRGIAAEQVALRLDDRLAADALMVGILRSFSRDVEAAGLSADTAEDDPAVRDRIRRIVDVGEAIAEQVLDALPGLPPTAAIDDCLAGHGFGRLEDGRLGVDIRRNHDLYASLFS